MACEMNHAVSPCLKIQQPASTDAALVLLISGSKKSHRNQKLAVTSPGRMLINPVTAREPSPVKNANALLTDTTTCRPRRKVALAFPRLLLPPSLGNSKNVARRGELRASRDNTVRAIHELGNHSGFAAPTNFDKPAGNHPSRARWILIGGVRPSRSSKKQKCLSPGPSDYLSRGAAATSRPVKRTKAFQLRRASWLFATRVVPRQRKKWTRERLGN